MAGQLYSKVPDSFTLRCLTGSVTLPSAVINPLQRHMKGRRVWDHDFRSDVVHHGWEGMALGA